MAEAAAKQNDRITAQDTHIIMVPSPNGEVPTVTPNHPFNGTINSNLSRNVTIMGQPAAMKDSTADNTPHTPLVSGRFQIPPSNKGTIVGGSRSVFINSRPAARNGDQAQTCDDVNPAPHGKVEATGTVKIGG